MQKSENYSPAAAFFINKVLLKQNHLFSYYLCLLSFLQRQSWVIATEILWPAKLKIFTTYPFIKSASTTNIKESY